MSLLALGVVFMVVDNYLPESSQEPADAVDYRRVIAVISMRINPSYDFVRTDPRFIDLLANTGLDH